MCALLPICLCILPQMVGKGKRMLSAGGSPRCIVEGKVLLSNLIKCTSSHERSITRIFRDCHLSSQILKCVIYILRSDADNQTLSSPFPQDVANPTPLAKL